MFIGVPILQCEKNMNIEEAIQIITKRINEPEPHWPEKPAMVVLKGRTIDRQWGWVFFYTSQLYLDTSNFSETLVGNAPYIVNRTTGEISETGTAHAIDYYINKYELELKQTE